MGAALNLWRAVNGVKWLFDLRRLIGRVEGQEMELNKILDLHRRATDLHINYDEEIEKDNIYSKRLSDFKKIVNNIMGFETQFSDHAKLIKTIEQVWEKGYKNP